MNYSVNARRQQRNRTDVIECQAQQKQALSDEHDLEKDVAQSPEEAITEWELNNLAENEIEKRRIILAKQELEKKQLSEQEKIQRELEIEQWREEEARKERGDVQVIAQPQKKKRRKPETFLQKIIRKIKSIFG